ncbi:MAG: GIY-YIG nuclease family protein [Candidatus Sungbacteria bacterium]|nr:GIY-YIG nuclease family protein [Candidatus Sungbacteria bacterium]
MYYVYILQSKRDDSIYIGYTPDLRKRMQEHEKGRVFSTKNMRPIELVYYEAYKDKSDAVKREQALKLHKKALAQLKNRISQSLIGGG